MFKKYKTIITTLALCGGLIMGFNTLKTPVYASDDAQTVAYQIRYYMMRC